MDERKMKKTGGKTGGDERTEGEKRGRGRYG